MGDDLTKRGGQDRKRISLTERWEVDYWTDALDVSEARLREIVEQVGDMAADVRAFLEREG
jgi:hypothetical protein